MDDCEPGQEGAVLAGTVIAVETEEYGKFEERFPNESEDEVVVGASRSMTKAIARRVVYLFSKETKACRPEGKPPKGRLIGNGGTLKVPLMRDKVPELDWRRVRDLVDHVAKNLAVIGDCMPSVSSWIRGYYEKNAGFIWRKLKDRVRVTQTSSATRRLRQRRQPVCFDCTSLYRDRAEALGKLGRDPMNKDAAENYVQVVRPQPPPSPPPPERDRKPGLVEVVTITPPDGFVVRVNEAGDEELTLSGAFGAVIDVAERKITLKRSGDVSRLGVMVVHETFIATMETSVRLPPRGQALVVTKVAGKPDDKSVVLVEGSGEGLGEKVKASKPDVPPDKEVVLEADFSQSKLSDEHKALFQQELNRFRDMFVESSKKPGRTDLLGFRIDTGETVLLSNSRTLLQALHSWVRSDFRFAGKVTVKDAPFEWTEDCETAFGQLKRALVKPPILMYPDMTKRFKLYVDSSRYAVGACLMQVVDGKDHVVAYASKLLTGSQKNWINIHDDISEIGGWGVVWATRMFRCYLDKRQFDLYTDHRALTWVVNLGNRTSNSMLARWAMELSNLDFKVHHKPGKSMGHVDELSRLLHNHVSAVTMADLLNLDETPEVATNDLVEEQGERDGLDIGSETEVQDEELADGDGATLLSLGSIVFSPWINQDSRKAGQMQRMPVVGLTGPFSLPIVDVIEPLPATERGNKYILAFVNYFTGWAEAFPVESLDSVTFVEVVINGVVARHGVPSHLLSYNGTNFTFEVAKSFYQALDIKELFGAAYHPQAQDLVERFNGTLIGMLRMHVSEAQNDWDLYFPRVRFAYRTAYHEALGDSPLFSLYGRDPVLPLDLAFLNLGTKWKSNEVAQYRRRLYRSIRDSRHLVERQLLKAQDRHERRLESPVPVMYEVGDPVWVFQAFRARRGEVHTKKLTHAWHGPYRVVARVNENAYRIDIPTHPSKIVTVNVNRMEKYRGKRTLMRFLWVWVAKWKATRSSP
ncbi:unnamed protein product [Phytophthora fragariaefolia]|uniref:Unnamed protein product n=1 Tax=Phytophthora fragariaefolia TaxID=1490495 RepID=A0A9W6XIH8_9STRA|nr:unnamed protein product [Phytophthora fragariaefolia]